MTDRGQGAGGFYSKFSYHLRWPLLPINVLDRILVGKSSHPVLQTRNQSMEPMREELTPVSQPQFGDSDLLHTERFPVCWFLVKSYVLGPRLVNRTLELTATPPRDKIHHPCQAYLSSEHRDRDRAGR